jgi:hypothetical protein
MGLGNVCVKLLPAVLHQRDFLGRSYCDVLGNNIVTLRASMYRRLFRV